MAKPNYTQNLIEIKEKLSALTTISGYQENHLSNIDQHLNKLNERTNKNERSVAKIYGIGAAVVFFVGVAIALVQVL